MGDHYLTRRNGLGLVFLLALYMVTGALWIAIPPAASALTEWNKTQVLQLKKGEILVSVRQTGNPPKGTVEAVILIESPPENIWRIMTDCREIPNFVPGLAACRVLDSGHNWEIIEHEVKWIRFLPTFTYVFRAEYKPNRKIEFVRVRGDLREIEGSWRLTPLDQNRRTIVSYSVFLDPGFFIPQWLVRRSLKADLPAVLTSLRKKVMNRRPGL